MVLDILSILVILGMAAYVIFIHPLRRKTRQGRTKLPRTGSAPHSIGDCDCPVCGTSVGAYGSGCPVCGAEFEDSVYRCPACASETDAGSTECPYCGEIFIIGMENRNAMNEKMTTHRKETGYRTGSIVYICPLCSAPVERYAPRCENCGAEFVRNNQII